MTRIGALACLASALALAGCASHGGLRPAPGQQRAPDDPGSAVAMADGVRMIVSTHAWDGDPPDLEQSVTPLHVTLENHSSHPLRIRYPELKLRSPALDYQPLPPAKLVDKQVTVREDPILVPRTETHNFRYAPYRYPNYSDAPGLRDRAHPWEDVPEFYTRQYAKWTVPLPTVDMIDRALPEGVLDPGGRVSGFLYFEHLRPGADQARFTFDLIDAQTALAFGTLRVRLVGH